MGLTMKDRFARLDMSKLPKSYQDEFEEMSAGTYKFSDEDLNDIFAENFNEMYGLVETKYPDAIKKGGTLKKVKKDKVKVIKPKDKADHEGLKYKPGDIVYYKEKDSDYFDPKYPKWKVKKEGKPGGVYIENDAHGQIFTMQINITPIKPVDDIKLPPGVRKKLSAAEIEEIEALLTDTKVSDNEIADRLETDFGLNHYQAKKWVSLRKKYQSEAKGSYSERTSQKKRARKGEDIVTTMDGRNFDRKHKRNIGKKFYDVNGKQWECVGYNAKIDECIFKDEDGKEISSCLKDMYTSNPVAKREKGNIVDECKETLKEAGFTVKEHKTGSKKISRSEPRPEKVIIKERVEESFTPIMKDLRGSEEKEKENKAIIDILEEIQGSFTKFMNRISNLADDKKLDALKKIKKLLDEIID